MSEFTDTEIIEAIAEAIGSGEVKLAVSLLKVLAVQSPHKAEEVLYTIRRGLTIAVTP